MLPNPDPLSPAMFFLSGTDPDPSPGSGPYSDPCSDFSFMVLVSGGKSRISIFSCHIFISFLDGLKDFKLNGGYLSALMAR